jgi:uncharacterized protein YdaT
MPWTKNNYPAPMKNLAPAVRAKAIQIANTLLQEKKISEALAITIAISHAKEWSKKHFPPVDPDDFFNLN